MFAVSLAEVADVAEIHPLNKAPVAEKLSNAILATLYGRAVEYTGPTLASVEREGDTLILTFTHADGLCLRNANGTPAETPLADAYFLTENGEKIVAEGKVDGERLLLNVPKGSVSFLFGYTDAPSHELYNAVGYLASPFRILL